MAINSINLISDYKERYFTPQQRAAYEERLCFAESRLLAKYSILWMVDVLPDGWGDLTSCLNAVHIVKQEYLHWNMKVLILISKSNNPINIEEYGLKPHEYLLINMGASAENKLLQNRINASRNWTSSHTDPDIKEDMLPLAEKIDSYLAFIKSSDMQISISTLVPGSSGSIDSRDINTRSPKFLYFEEYKGQQDCDVPNIFSMGVTPASCGIYILDAKEADHFEDPILQKYFNDEEKTYFNYGDNVRGYASLVNGLNPDAKELNIVTNVSTMAIEKIDLEGVQTILFVNKEGHETVLSHKDHPGKVMRFINLFPICHPDMLRAIRMSQEPVGVTGNCTFSESLDKLPFYNNRDGLVSFWEGLISLAKHATPQNPLLIDYLEQLLYKESEMGDRKIHIRPQDLPLLQTQWSELVAILKRDWNVKNAYLGEIHRYLLLRNQKDSSQQFIPSLEYDVD